MALNHTQSHTLKGHARRRPLAAAGLSRRGGRSPAGVRRSPGPIGPRARRISYSVVRASTVDFIIRRCQGSRNIYHGFLWKSGVAASLPAGMEFVPEFHIHCYSCVPTHHGWCARLCSRLYRPADDRASVFYSPPELSYRIVSIRMYPYTRHRCCHLFPFRI